MEPIAPCHICSARASSGPRTLFTASLTSAARVVKRVPSWVTAVAAAPPRMGANAWDRLFHTPGRKVPPR